MHFHPWLWSVWSIRTCTGYMWFVQADRLSETQQCLNLFRRKKLVRCFFSFFFCMCAPFHDVTSTPFVPRDMRTPLTHRDCNGNLWVFTKWHNTKDWTDYKQCPPKLQQLTGALIGVLDQRRSQRFFMVFKPSRNRFEPSNLFYSLII